MAAPSTEANVTASFKRVYGGAEYVAPKDELLSQDIPFSFRQRIGEGFYEAIVLNRETGITTSSDTTAYAITGPRSAVVQQSYVTSYESVLASALPWGVISRTQGGDDVAFFDATKYIVKNNLESHEQFQEIYRLYGQSPDMLGYVSYFTGTYRGQAFVDGTGNLNGLAFVNGVAPTLVAGQFAILLRPGYFAAGIWTGMEGAEFYEVSAANVVVNQGYLVSSSPEYGYIVVNVGGGSPTVATALTSHRVALKGIQDSKIYFGMDYIIGRQGTLFGIDNTQYSLWQGTTVDLTQTATPGKLTLAKINMAIATLVNRGGLRGKLTGYINPRSWTSLTNDEAALRLYDTSYSPKRFENGAESIMFYSQNGVVEFKPHRMVMEGKAFFIHQPVWSRSGSSDISFTIPGMSMEVIFPMESQAGFNFRSYSDQYMFCRRPAYNLRIVGINDESLV